MKKSAKTSKPDVTIKASAPKSFNAWALPLIVLVPLVLIVAGLILYFLGPTGQRTYDYAFEIDRFSGHVEIFSPQTDLWQELTRKTAVDAMIHSGDRVRTGKGADIDFKIPGFIDVRLKPASELHLIASRSEEMIHLKLHHGTLLAMTEAEIGMRKAELEYDSFRMVTEGGSLMLSGEEPNRFSLSVLDGVVELRDNRFDEMTQVNALEIFSASEEDVQLPKPARVTYQQWRAVNEVRDLSFTPTEEIKRQRDLTKEAGSLFKYVFDEGTFFTPNLGYAERTFYKDDDGVVVLRVHYDVYPQDSYSGIYLKTRDLDISKFKGLSFELRSASDQPIPNLIRIEMKDRLSTVRGFAVKPITRDWRLYAFNFNAQKQTPVTEIVFVFENTRVGPLSLIGTVYIKNISIA